MTTSGTYAFQPSVGESVLASYARINLRRPALTAEHFADARNEANLLQTEWLNRGVNLWTVDLQSVPLTAATAAYAIPATTVMILDAYVTITVGGVATDRIVTPVSRTEYASFPTKQTPGPPTVFWFDRLISPTVYLWPTPDSGGPYTFNYYRFRQIQDANLPSGIAPEVPVRWLDAFVAGLAHRLARIHAPPLEQIRKADADQAWTLAATADTENVNLYIVPGLSNYYRP